MEQEPAAEQDTLTSPPPGTLAGTVLGTVGYMAPEQVRGEPADYRSDIFAVGCVLHEMLTGRSPFRRGTAVETMAAILREEPPEVSLSGVEIVPELARLLGRCLEKQPAQRFQSAGDLAFALRSLTGGRTAAAAAPAEAKAGWRAKPLSIAVLPFANLSPDRNTAFFADALTEELIADLSKIGALRVISRTSTFAFKGTTKTVPAIARELNVRYVLEGSVRRSGDSLRITAQLIDTETDAHLWAEKYDGVLDDVFDLQEQLSRRIVEQLEVRLGSDEDRRLAARPLEDVRAHDIWLRARQSTMGMTREGFERALRLVEEALSLVGDNALLHATLAWIHMVRFTSLSEGPEEVLEIAERHAARAMALNPELAWAHFVTGAGDHRRGRIQEFVRCLQRALEIERDAHVLAVLGVYLPEMGKTEAARQYAREAAALAGDRQGVLGVLSSESVERLVRRFGSTCAAVGSCLARVGEHSSAMEWLGAGVEHGYFNHEFLGRHDRLLAPLHDLAPFAALLERARQRERALQV